MLFENNEREEQRLLGGLILAFGIGLGVFSMALTDYRIPEPSEPEETMQLVVAPDLPAEKPKPEPKPKEKPQPKPKETAKTTTTKPKAEAQKPASKPSKTPTPNATAGGGSTPHPSVSQPVTTENAQPKDAAAELGAMFGAQQTTSSNATTYKAPTASSGNGATTARTVSSSSTNATTKPLVVGSQTVSQSLTQVTAAKPTGSGTKTRHSAVLEREISSESGAVDRDITSLFLGLKAEIRQQVVSYGIRNQTLRFTVNLSQGQVTSVTVAGIPSELQRSLNRLLSGRRINSTFTGVKSHVVIVN
ncbi:hypothetical protein [Vibrio parahaemolyticus]|uniref:hypothetical protein n=1 Tax=Vibrio parahaemolyticus TaxID=670 RepID=UPI001124238C|nr:hypothetical protein [Vibrio parahaemolyticus]TOK04613.1 hypothetical protein CGI25_22325 [Vibrio parahaemolyticus]